MADFRLRIGFAKTGAAIWLSHLEVVRAMERCLRRSGLPYDISQGFSPHIKHSFSTALPVGTGSSGEFMDVELTAVVEPEQALLSLQAVQHECLPVLTTQYIPRDEPSLQVYFNLGVYLVQFANPAAGTVPEIARRLSLRPVIDIRKKAKPKTYDLNDYLLDVACVPGSEAATAGLRLELLSLPSGSLRPEVMLQAIAAPDLDFKIEAITRIELLHKELP